MTEFEQVMLFLMAMQVSLMVVFMIDYLMKK